MYSQSHQIVGVAIGVELDNDYANRDTQEQTQTRKIWSRQASSSPPSNEFETQQSENVLASFKRSLNPTHPIQYFCSN